MSEGLGVHAARRGGRGHFRGIPGGGIRLDRIRDLPTGNGGVHEPLTLRIAWKVRTEKVTILIDNGSTHNFINPMVATRVRHAVG